MKRIINGKAYNTGTAKMLANWTNGKFYDDCHWANETLYQKENSEYFLWMESNSWAFTSPYEDNGKDIIKMSIEQSKAWVEHRANDKYEAIFGAVKE